MRKSQGKYCRLLLNNVMFLEDFKKSPFLFLAHIRFYSLPNDASFISYTG